MNPVISTSPILPAPDLALQQHSARVKEHIAARIEQRSGPLTLGEFVHEALYAPGLGYYAAGLRKFGADGDFVTAPELGDVFATAMAERFAALLPELTSPVVLELGAGSGQFAHDVLLALDERSALPQEYWILEVSGDLIDRQRQLISMLPKHLASRVRWLPNVPDEPFDGIVFANEVLDALPFERFCIAENGQEDCMHYVDIKDQQLQLLEGEANTAVISAVEGLRDKNLALPAGYCGEVRPGLANWLSKLVKQLQNGAVLFVDYGSHRSELYLEDRSTGTMTCHYRHRVHDDILFLPGLQDITAWVDFSQVAEAGTCAGLSIDGYTTQSSFLLGCNLDKWLALKMEGLPEKQRMALASEIRTLTMPGDMGERFKVIAFTRGDVTGLMPDAAASLTARLAG